jgi:hypothetical protein
MKHIVLVFIIVLSVSFGCKEFDNSSMYEKDINSLFTKAQILGYNTEYAIIIDYSIHSGLKRGFLMDKDHYLHKSFLVAHGSGNGTKDGIPKSFSNNEGSNASSLGIAVLDGRDYSHWGINIKYWLKGLDETNSNLKKRVVVLHSWEGIPDENIYPNEIVSSQGCPTVSNSTLTIIDSLVLMQNNKKILILFRK